MPNFEPDEEGAAIVARLHDRARAHGRDPADIGFEPTVNVLGRTPEQWREDALAWRTLGATHLSANTMQEEWDEVAGMWSKAEGARIERADATSKCWSATWRRSGTCSPARLRGAGAWFETDDALGEEDWLRKE